MGFPVVSQKFAQLIPVASEGKSKVHLYKLWRLEWEKNAPPDWFGLGHVLYSGSPSSSELLGLIEETINLPQSNQGPIVRGRESDVKRKCDKCPPHSGLYTHLGPSLLRWVKSRLRQLADPPQVLSVSITTQLNVSLLCCSGHTSFGWQITLSSEAKSTFPLYPLCRDLPESWSCRLLHVTLSLKLIPSLFLSCLLTVKEFRKATHARLRIKETE